MRSSSCASSSARPCTATSGNTVIEGPRKLAASFDGPVDMTSMPDVAPTLMMIAPFLNKPTRITGLATLRVKECDRIAAPTRELRKLGIEVEEGPDYMVIQPLARRSAQTGRDPRSWKSRLTTTTASRCPSECSVRVLPGLRILDPGCVAKTYPNYWRDWQRARGHSRRAG